MPKRTLGLLLSHLSLFSLLTLLPAAAHGQSLDLGIANTGLSIGNSPRWTGLRINWADRDVERVNGVNLTLWKPPAVRDDQGNSSSANPDFTMNGIALGLVAPVAARFNGVAAGLGGVIAHEAVNGIALGGIGVVSEGTLNGIVIGGLGVVAERGMNGIHLGGLGLVSEGRMRGINLAGLGTVSDGAMIGINAAGLGLVSEGDMSGVNLGGLGVVADGDLTGLNAAGLGTVSQGRVVGINLGGLGVIADGDLIGVTIAGLGAVSQGGMRGINVGGLALVAEGPVEWVNIGGLAVVSSGGVRGITSALGTVVSDTSITGLSSALYRIQAPEVRGIAVALAHLRADRFTGVGTGAYTRIGGVQRGLTIAIYNHANELHGMQIGLLNRADNNSGIARILPLLNFHR